MVRQRCGWTCSCGHSAQFDVTIPEGPLLEAMKRNEGRAYREATATIRMLREATKSIHHAECNGTIVVHGTHDPDASSIDAAIARCVDRDSGGSTV